MPPPKFIQINEKQLFPSIKKERVWATLLANFEYPCISLILICIVGKLGYVELKKILVNVMKNYLIDLNINS